MEIELVDDDGSVIGTVEAYNIEVSDDLGFNVDNLREANDTLPEGVAEIRILVPEDY